MIVLAVLVILAMLLLLCRGAALATAYPRLPLAITSVALTLWLVEVFVSTFRAPFLTTGNGYFASWAGLGAAAYVCKPHLPEWMQAKVARVRQSVKHRVMDARENAAARGGEAAAPSDEGGSEAHGDVSAASAAAPTTPASATSKVAARLRAGPRPGVRSRRRP